MRRVIRLGDPTSHGGAVVSAAERYTMDGIPVARMGDMCTCPVRGHTGCTIVEGDPAWSIDGRPVALEGHLTSCGAALISTFGRLGRGHDTGNANTVTGQAIAQANSSPAKSPDGHKDFNDRYAICCAVGGEPLANVEYAIVRANGAVEYGTTDEQGHTHLLTSIAIAEQVAIHVEG